MIKKVILILSQKVIFFLEIYISLVIIIFSNSSKLNKFNPNVIFSFKILKKLKKNKNYQIEESKY